MYPCTCTPHNKMACIAKKLEWVLAVAIGLCFFIPMSMNSVCEPLDIFCFHFSFWDTAPPHLSSHLSSPLLDSIRMIKADLTGMLATNLAIFFGPIGGFFLKKIGKHKLLKLITRLLVFLITVPLLIYATASYPGNADEHAVLIGYYFFLTVACLYVLLLLLDLLASVYSGCKALIMWVRR